MFIEIGRQIYPAPEGRNVRDVAPTSWGNYRSTFSINIPRLRRSGIADFASIIIPARQALPGSEARIK
jgi:hypothetical protein